MQSLCRRWFRRDIMQYIFFYGPKKGNYCRCASSIADFCCWFGRRFFGLARAQPIELYAINALSTENHLFMERTQIGCFLCGLQWQIVYTSQASQQKIYIGFEFTHTQTIDIIIVANDTVARRDDDT